MKETPSAKAHHTAKWARTMTKWLISYSRRKGVKWQFVEFCGPRRAESVGIVDIIAMRKDHRRHPGLLKRGDRMDIVLIQTKGGGARGPSADDITRLKLVAKHHRARAVVLATWRKNQELRFYRLHRSAWVASTVDEMFG